MKSEYVPRVNQLDAIELNDVIQKIVRDQLTKALGNLAPGLLSQYQPELDLILRAVIWHYSTNKQLATFGQQLLFICYDPEQMTKFKILWYFILNVFAKYVRDVITFRMTNHATLQTTVQWTDNAFSCLEFVNFFRFLKTGHKPALIDLVLGLNHISMFGNRRRDVGYSHMTRELIWGGFMELLGFTIPLINYHSVKRKIRNSLLVFGKKKNMTNENQSPVMYITTKCAYCNERPTLPHHMGCSHIFCYYCLQGNMLADSNFQCPICDWNDPKQLVQPL